eukprot:1332130-Pyramimonas_sp.AAC.1
MMCASMSISASSAMVGGLPSSVAGAGGRSSSWAWPSEADASARSSHFERSSSKPANGFEDAKHWIIRAFAVPAMSWISGAVPSDS